MGFPIIKLQQTDSTNRYLTSLCEERADKLEPFTVVMADYQSAGKGQRGNSWESASGANLTFSFVLYPSFVSANRQFAISQIVSLGIVNALGKYAKDVFSIKWPNDIYYHDKKICGILIEVYLEGMRLGRCVCGVGLNVNQEVFCGDAPNPISLCEILGKKIDRMGLLHEVMDEISGWYDKLAKADEAIRQDLAKTYFHHLYRRNGFYRYKDPNGEFMARLMDVEPDGRLILEDSNKIMRRYLFKEIQFII